MKQKYFSWNGISLHKNCIRILIKKSFNYVLGFGPALSQIDRVVSFPNSNSSFCIDFKVSYVPFRLTIFSDKSAELMTLFFDDRSHIGSIPSFVFVDILDDLIKYYGV